MSAESAGPLRASLAPLAVFAFKKARAVEQVLLQLSKCADFDQTPLFVFSDGPRTVDDVEQIARLRARVKALNLPNLRLVERATNLGLARSISAGVTELCERFGRVIVLEDDHLPAPSMLRWFNQGLVAYEAEESVAAISGYMFDIPSFAHLKHGVFFGHPASPCWAVWKRSWSMYDERCAEWRDWMLDPDYVRAFRVQGAMRFEHMMRDQKAGRSNSWAIRWHAVVIRHRKLVLYPPRSMVVPIETDSLYASNGNRTGALLPTVTPWEGSIPPELPATVQLDEWAVRAWARRLRYSAYGFAHMLSGALYEWRYRHEPIP